MPSPRGQFFYRLLGVGVNSDSNLADRVHDLIYELALVDGTVLLKVRRGGDYGPVPVTHDQPGSVLPRWEDELRLEDRARRLAATALVPALLASPRHHCG